MAVANRIEVFFLVAALAGVGWTISASELWVAAQRAIPPSARGRMNATVIMISQGAMALGGLIWGSAGAIVGASHTMLGVAVLFLSCLFVARRLSINATGYIRERVSVNLAVGVEPPKMNPETLTGELVAAGLSKY
ncbi:MAG: MFS transporter, partial [Verrucomicrobia bacterium]|nr:MFS transporter [Verrucomicrobiota bacterium]